MKIEEAIEHLDECIKRLRAEGCEECAKEHEQLKGWLEELADLRAQQEAEKNEPLTLHQLNEMHGQPIWLDDSPNGWKCFIVNLCPVKDGKMVGSPCGVDFYGDLTSLSILLECGVYRRPPVKEET